MEHVLLKDVEMPNSRINFENRTVALIWFVWPTA